MKDSKMIEKKNTCMCVCWFAYVSVYIYSTFIQVIFTTKSHTEKKMHRLSSSKWTRVLMAFGLLDSELIFWEEI